MYPTENQWISFCLNDVEGESSVMVSTYDFLGRGLSMKSTDTRFPRRVTEKFVVCFSYNTEFLLKRHVYYL